MKKLSVIAFAALLLGACAESTRDNKDSTTIGSDKEATTTTETTYTPQEGDVSFKDNKVLVMKNGAWVEADEDVTLDNGVVVYRTGKVRKDNKEIVLEDGEVVTRTGNFFDRTGRAIEKAWYDTKDAVKEAGKDVKKGAKKVGDKVEDAVDGKNDNK